MNNPTIFIIDDDLSVRRGLNRLLNAVNIPNENFDSAKEFLDSEKYKEPGCIVLDIRMPDMLGIELQDYLIKMKCHMPIIFLSGHGDIPMATKSMKKGAVDFLTKPVDKEELLDAIEMALAMDTDYRNVHADESENLNKLLKLTPREYCVMTYVITGLLNKQIADKMGIAVDTVKIHRGRFMKKLEIVSVAELVRLCEKMSISPAKVSP